MTYEFEIIYLRWHHNRGDFIFAKHLGIDHELTIPEGSVFGDIPVYDYKEMRGLENGEQRDVFVFRPLSGEFLPKDYFSVGQRVVLTIKNILT